MLGALVQFITAAVRVFSASDGIPAFSERLRITVLTRVLSEVAMVYHDVLPYHGAAPPPIESLPGGRHKTTAMTKRCGLADLGGTLPFLSAHQSPGYRENTHLRVSFFHSSLWALYLSRAGPRLAICALYGSRERLSDLLRFLASSVVCTLFRHLGVSGVFGGFAQCADALGNTGCPFLMGRPLLRTRP